MGLDTKDAGGWSELVCTAPGSLFPIALLLFNLLFMCQAVLEIIFLFSEGHVSFWSNLHLDRTFAILDFSWDTIRLKTWRGIRNFAIWVLLYYTVFSEFSRIQRAFYSKINGTKSEKKICFVYLEDGISGHHDSVNVQSIPSSWSKEFRFWLVNNKTLNGYRFNQTLIRCSYLFTSQNDVFHQAVCFLNAVGFP